MLFVKVNEAADVVRRLMHAARYGNRVEEDNASQSEPKLWLASKLLYRTQVDV